MNALTNSERSPAALLSAVAATENAEIALIAIVGKTLLEHQIIALRRAGIERFFIEVADVSGALMAIAHNVRRTGCSVEFIRSAQDLQALATERDKVLVMAEGVFIAPSLTTSFTANSDLFIATVDSRSENEAFERMDLNTRWAGLARVDGRNIAALGVLPDGWSLASSLLRQAMRDHVPQHLLKQHHITDGDIRKISADESSNELVRHILSARMSREPGFIEAQLFAPLAKILVPQIWRYHAGAVASEAAMLLLAGATVASAALGWQFAAFVAAFFVLFVRLTWLLAYDRDRTSSRWIELATWILLTGAVFGGASTDGYRTADSVFAAFIMVGLAVLAIQLRLPKWAERTLRSPALLVLSLFALTMPLGFVAAVRWMSVIQLLLLLVAKWTHGQTQKV